MRTALHEAFVLHRRAWRETSLLLEVLSCAHGRVGLIARGARRPRSRLGPLEPFQPLTLAWSGSGELGTLTAAEPSGHALRLRGERLASGFYVNELVLRLLPRHDPSRTLFRAYGATVQALAGARSLEPALRLFEKTLLETLGYVPRLERDAHTGAPVEPELCYDFHPELGPVAARSGTLQIHGRTLLALAGGSMDEDARTLQEAKRLMRVLLRPHLGDRPLFSRELLRG